MVPTLAALAVAGTLAVEPAAAAGATGFTDAPRALSPLSGLVGAPCAPVGPGLAADRMAPAREPDATSGALRFIAGLGASLAWDLADLPRRRARLPEPIGGFIPGAAFRAHLARGGTGRGGAIGALTDRWNELYPPYAIEGPAGP